MKHLLARANRGLLASSARRHTVLVFDFDGTLAPIVPRPDDAHMRSRTRVLLASAARSYPCAIITGRAIADIAPRLRGVGLACTVGNHGGEWEGAAPRTRHIRAKVREWRVRLSEQLAGTEGLFIEDKGLSLAIHYRQAHDQRAARTAIRSAVASLPAAKLVGGKCVANVVPANAPHKGTALRQIQRMFRAESTIYVGDDETDELAFPSGASPGLITVRVGPSRSSRAAYYLRSQREIDSLLAILLALRRDGAASRSGRR
ncbi:MAG: trehalose-phosphatase [Acidobacteria bacterium]|nr:trehalose-phosphatase [Acidobacteriota bacterium]